MDNVFALAAATAILVLIPGPNVALIVANSLRHGLSFGLVTALGTTVGVALQLSLVIAGVAALIGMAAAMLGWIKWLGVVYLFYLGVRTWFEPAADLDTVRPQMKPVRIIFWRGLGLAVMNPKTLLFNAAFLPQFASTGSEAVSQLIVLAAVFLLVLGVGDSLWAGFASLARPILQRYSRVRNKLVGGFLCSAGLGLALSMAGNDHSRDL